MVASMLNSWKNSMNELSSLLSAKCDAWCEQGPGIATRLVTWFAMAGGCAMGGGALVMGGAGGGGNWRSGGGSKCR